MKIRFTKDGIVKTVSTGISFSTLFFGFFVAIFRRQWIILLLTYLSFGFSNLYFMFTANKLYAQSLTKDGWKVMPEDQASAYVYFGIIPHTER